MSPQKTTYKHHKPHCVNIIELLINNPVSTNACIIKDFKSDNQFFMVDSPLPNVPPCMRVRFLLNVDWTFTILNETKQTIRLFLSCFLRLCQNESWRETIHMKMGFDYRFVFIQIKLIFICSGFAKSLILKQRQKASQAGLLSLIVVALINVNVMGKVTVITYSY